MQYAIVCHVSGLYFLIGSRVCWGEGEKRDLGHFLNSSTVRVLNSHKEKYLFKELIHSTIALGVNMPAAEHGEEAWRISNEKERREQGPPIIAQPVLTDTGFSLHLNHREYCISVLWM